MPDYSLGRAHGQIEIDYDGRGADQAAAGLDKVAASSIAADKSLDKTQKTLGDTEKGFDSAGSSAEGYRQRLKDVESAGRDVESAERNLRSTLLDTRASLDDIKDAEDRVTESKKKHTAATNASRDAHKALSDEMKVGQGAMAALSSIIPNLHASLDRLANVSGSATDKASGLSGKLSGLAKVVGFLGPEGKAAAAGLLLVSKGMDTVGEKAGSSSGFVSGLVQQIASFEVGFGKIAGLSLGAVSLGGLAGLGGAAGVQGIVELAGAAEQLSGALGLLPSVISAVEFSSQTLQVAFHGVDSALKDMMSDDPKKFLEDIKNMGPVAAQAMLGVAQFRDEFKLAGAAVQDSFFAKIAGDIAPLIQTWLPAIAAGMSQVSGIFGDAAHQFAGLLNQPAVMAAFQSFIENLSAGLTALQPAMAPLLEIFTQLTVVGSSLFGQLGDRIVQMLDFFTQLVDKAAASGQLKQWITDGINAFGHLINIAYSFSSAFLNIMDVAEKFGGGGLLGWLEQLTDQFNKWTQSADGQKALTDFFTVLRQATDAFTPMLKPLVEGLASIGTAFVQLGVATAPGWLTFFNTFAQTMQMLGPQIVGMGPAINTFLTGMSFSFGQLVATLGPQLPRIFQDLANAFVALTPQIPQLAVVFIQLVESVGPQLPKFFGAITNLITQLLPYLPTLIGLVQNFVSILTWFIQTGGTVIGWFSSFLGWVGKFAADVPGTFDKVKTAIADFFTKLAGDAVNWGKSMVNGLIDGITGGLGSVGGAARDVVEAIARWFQSSPAKVGPFSGSGYTLIRGQKMVTDMAAGMVAAQGSIESAAASTAAAASGALSGAGAGSGGTGGAPSPGGADTTGNALLPDNIASASTAPLTAYLRHQFSDTNGLKGLAKDLGNILDVAKNGFDLLNTHGIQPVFQALGMLPGAKDQAFRKMTPKELAASQQSDVQKDALKDNKHTWNDVFGIGAPGTSTAGNGVSASLGLTASSSKADIQKAIIAAGRARGMSDGAIKTALAVAADESGFNPTISGGNQGSAGAVSGLYQQSPSSGWGTMDQVNDPNHAINAFYDAFAKQLTSNPKDPLLAAVLTQNPQLGSGAQGSDYMNAVSAKLGEANSIFGAYGKDTKGLAWGAGGSISMPPTAGLPPGAKVGADGSISVPPGTALPTGAAAPGGLNIMANPQSRASTLGGASANYTPETMAAAGIAPLFTKSAPGSMAGAPAWVQQLASAFGLTATSHQDSTLHGGTGQMGDWAFDFAGAVPDMQKFADFVKTNLASQTLQGIWQNPQSGQQVGIAGGQILGPGQYYNTPGGSYADHQDHFHWATDVAPVFMGPNGQPLPTGPTPLSAQAGIGSGAVPGGGLILPSGQSLNALTDTTQKNLSVNDKLLQSYLQGNPALAAQINAAKTPGAADQTVMDSLTGINTTIDTLKQQDAVGNKNTIDALQGQQSSIAQQQGFTQGQSGLQTAQSAVSGVGAAVTGAFQIAQNVLDSMTATQDITDRLVYGVRNTEDVSKLVDDVQKYITLAASIATETGSILSSVGGLLGAGAGADPTGGASAAAAGVQGAAQISQLIGGVLAGVNMAIDFGQQVYELTMGYVGKFMSVLTGLGGGTDLMGNVGFLLNKNTGQLLSYSQDNPEQKNVANVPSWMNSLYDYNGKGNPNPQVQQQLNIYAGPGQSPAEMMNETMWMVNTGGTTGAMAANNF